MNIKATLYLIVTCYQAETNATGQKKITSKTLLATFTHLSRRYYPHISIMQRFEAVGASALALAFDHVALALERRNTYV